MICIFQSNLTNIVNNMNMTESHTHVIAYHSNLFV